MISNPKHGWCDFKLGGFIGTASYLTDVPIDLLDAFIDYYTKGYGVAVLDEEGSDFTLVLTRYNQGIFVIAARDMVSLSDFSHMKPDDLARELINDLENDLMSWSFEFTFTDIAQHKNDILQKIAELTQLIEG